MTDAERIKHIKKLMDAEMGVSVANAWWLLDRLAAVEKERDAYKRISDTYLTEAGLRTKEHAEARAEVERLTERVLWLERDGKCQSMHKMDAEVARLRAERDHFRRELGAAQEARLDRDHEIERLEAVVEAARERHDGCEVAANHRAFPSRCGVCWVCAALEALDEERTDG